MFVGNLVVRGLAMICFDLMRYIENYHLGI